MLKSCWYKLMYRWTIYYFGTLCLKLTGFRAETQVDPDFNVFRLFPYYTCILLEKDGAFHLNKFESPWPKDALCQDWLKFAQWFWRRFVIFIDVLSLFLFYITLQNLVALHFNKLWFSGSGEEKKCESLLRRRQP